MKALWIRRGLATGLGVVVLAATGYVALQYRDGAATPAPEPAAGEPLVGDPSALVNSAPPSLVPSAPAPSAVSALPSPSKSVKPSPTKAAKPGTGGFPGAHNTGVPAGTNLSRYSGPCTVTKSNTVVSGKTIDCDPFLINAKNVVIRRSLVKGTLTTTEATGYSFTLEDSEVAAGMWQGPAVLSTNMTIRRSNIHGGQTSVSCYANCDIRDSWLHGQLLKDGTEWHLGGFLANDTGGSGRSNVTLIHNTIVCDAATNSAGGGCSGNVNLFPDFGPVSGILIRNNYLGASPHVSYCLYGGSEENKQFNDGVRDIVVEDNVFERGANKKCGGYGPVTSFNTKLPGNRWANNIWSDGKPVPPAN
ncbi:hypothetical protein [Actinoplanes derwentensis]|uniref:Right handed beta helix region n=1 Tax=Actinoplanes derwentensis TaxID=113562 RepID=A0A1H2BBA0_9ACTN|nr:hypothetical protein [Actinoplanes derwentensis]GID86506.1 hypothetical protein Ade03nite_54300 [Actinoplanes derwentensis]SDT55337.1 hypothetical protein SAMN04489716_4475 [Actinoplanes derwentensis]